MFKKILVAVAGRGLCEQMMNMLLEIPSIQRDTQVTLLHVVPKKSSERDIANLLEEGGKILAQAVDSLKLDEERINPRLKQGDPKQTVLDVAAEENSDLIIMGSRALGRLQSILQQSVSQYVFQTSTRPMLLVKDDVYVKRLNRVLVALDGSETAQESLQVALKLLQEVSGSSLTLLHVNPESKIASPDQDPILVDAAQKAKVFGVNTELLHAMGNAGEKICQIAEEKNVDLMVLGSPDRRPSIAKKLPDLDRLLGSSLSDYVRVQANCPVLLVRNTSN
ncbi:universal stress protein [Roseofilum reptotaenium CS-1145]|uniref:Universal stress protein UspA n=1 Tax=Roseofilum reptotaenium AO1-A TaxID=1925591 RepID=A0A1L9QKG8_9CYAN|nr:universal stress protein [Roseofilum reptotaenium]MDB9515613.1 universal stress protein [Roseofilum reptotaenium CS-1145]OJJ16537.1 universal stress protein UspA [Roseofilum reptotaenium AO1-A]